MRALLGDFPQEAELLAVFFEEYGLQQARQAHDATRAAGAHGSGGGSGGGDTIEQTIGDDDEVDWKDAE